MEPIPWECHLVISRNQGKETRIHHRDVPGASGVGAPDCGYAWSEEATGAHSHLPPLADILQLTGMLAAGAVQAGRVQRLVARIPVPQKTPLKELAQELGLVEAQDATLFQERIQRQRGKGVHDLRSGRHMA